MKCINIKIWRSRMEVPLKSGDEQPIDSVRACAGDIGKKWLSPLADWHGCCFSSLIDLYHESHVVNIASTACTQHQATTFQGQKEGSILSHWRVERSMKNVPASSCGQLPFCFTFWQNSSPTSGTSSAAWSPQTASSWSGPSPSGTFLEQWSWSALGPC